ncbi:MAG: carbamoyl phosphate synthase small subunit [Eubacteriales bacterium]|nr:carbamoyl phosphate synthase small subunit [Eubacteriales bacterium]MDD3881677.1 carbamoyl phosphate synthase small subunit [Eubacteriales bacterium]MDD4512264.1 carbamoyl phosphate synthase small subunit [Eubacteriales bacterium]
MAYLILEDGTVFEGELFGAKNCVTGEVVFTTGMTGYQETLTDPSYDGQIVTMTYPLIGNVGINSLDFESEKVHMKGFVISELCSLPSNWQMKKRLEDYLEEQNVTGLCGVDTRALTRKLREVGTLRGRISAELPEKSAIAEIAAHVYPKPVLEVTSKEAWHIDGEKEKRVAVMDFGLKRGILRSLSARGCDLTIFPSMTSAETILGGDFDGVMLTNGPGDPEDNPEDIKTIETLMKSGIPVFGICLGHQLMALAMGGKTVKMKYGHHGANHPVKDLRLDRCYVTAQNHNYMVDSGSLPQTAKVTHLNWNDRSVEGVMYTDIPSYSVQFHPEACAGPHETTYLFDDFIALIKAHHAGK